MSGVLVFVIFLALILVGGYFKAKKEANSTPLKKSFNRAASLWNSADSKHRAIMLASIGVFENSPSFAVYLTSTWGQLDLKLCALLAATLDAIRENSTVTSEEPARMMERNPALEELESQPKTAITSGLIAAVPALATDLYGDAEKQASALGISDPAFTDCVFDLQLVGAFERTMDFTGDKNLASLFVDAVIFKATGKSPSVPSEADINVGSTRQHRGLPKYALARKQFSVRDPIALLFGREYATAKARGLNPDDVDRGVIAAIYIRQAGAWAAEIALTGKRPTSKEMDALRNLGPKIQPARDGDQSERNRHEHLETVGSMPIPEEKMPENPLQKVGWPTKEQIEKHFEAWQKGGQLGLLKAVQENQKEED